MKLRALFFHNNIISGVIITLGLTLNIQAQKLTLEQANDFFWHQDYAEAVKAYHLILKSDTTNGMAWTRLGSSLYQLKRYSESAKAYLHAEKLNLDSAPIRYSLACDYALTGQKEAAFRWLSKALDVGYAQIKHLESDEALASLRRDSRFPGLLQRADHNARPCEFDEHFRQFDFWLGEWAVYNPAGLRVGTSHIEKLLAGCMLQENGTSVGGISGKSTNYFDPASGKWIQLYVSESGNNIYYKGDFKAGGMHFMGEKVNLNGTRSLSRMTIEPMSNGNVHQLIESSHNNGLAWEVEFDRTYVPVAKDYQSQ